MVEYGGVSEDLTLSGPKMCVGDEDTIQCLWGSGFRDIW